MTAKSDLQTAIDSLEGLAAKADKLDNKHLRDVINDGQGRLIDAMRQGDIDKLEDEPATTAQREFPEPAPEAHFVPSEGAMVPGDPAFAPSNPGFAHPDNVELNPDGTLRQAPNVAGKSDVRKE